MKKIVLLLLVCMAVALCGTAQGVTTILYRVTLNENPSTGYQWFYLISDEAMLSITDHGYEATEGVDPLLDEGGTHYWTIGGLEEGEASITFTSMKPWQEQITDLVFSFTFSVDADGNLTLLSTERLPEDYAPGRTMVRLIENPTTGYHWEMEANPDGVLKLIVDNYEQDPAPEGMVGVGGVHTWVYRGESQGSTTLTFRYVGPSGGDPAATVMFFYTVDANLLVSQPGIEGDYAQYNPYLKK